ncbi:MAG: hypothetical protein AVDCRST_MAG58-4037, partial [uncultured Rubrobacteraceae bacterium]
GDRTRSLQWCWEGALLDEVGRSDARVARQGAPLPHWHCV